MTVCGPKNLVVLQVDDDQYAEGVPHPEGFGELPVKSDGIDARYKFKVNDDVEKNGRGTSQERTM